MRRAVLALFVFFLLFSFVTIAIAEDEQGVAECNNEYNGYPSITINGIPVLVIASPSLQEIMEWSFAIKYATEILLRSPNNILNRLVISAKSNRSLEILLLCNNTHWYSGIYDPAFHLIYINQLPNIEDYPFDFEHIAKDGFGQTEKIFVVLHEMAHSFDFNSDGAELLIEKTYIDDSSDDVYTNPWYFLNFLKELPPTKYPIGLCFYNVREDWADSFVFFVLRPSYLKQCCPIRYQLFKRLFGTEYKDLLPLPSSIESKLLKKNETLTCIRKQ